MRAFLILFYWIKRTHKPGCFKNDEKTFDTQESLLYNSFVCLYGSIPFFLWGEQETPGIADKNIGTLSKEIREETNAYY